MRRLKKYVPILASILCSIFMFSVGFSSWLVVNSPSSVQSSGNFVAYAVNQYVECDLGPTVFDYTSIYFIESDREDYGLGTTNTGYITVTYNFTDAAKDKMTSAAGLALTFNLWYQDAKLDSEGNQPKMFTTNTKATLSTGTTEYKLSEAADTFSFTETFKYDDTTKIPDSVTVTYTFLTEVGAKFRSDFGQYLLNNKDGVSTKFFTSAEAEVNK